MSDLVARCTIGGHACGPNVIAVEAWAPNSLSPEQKRLVTDRIGQSAQQLDGLIVLAGAAGAAAASALSNLPMITVANYAQPTSSPQIVGLGAMGIELAIEAMARRLRGMAD